MSSRTLYVLVTVSREWPWEERGRLERVLGEEVAAARKDGFTRFVLVHGAYDWSTHGFYRNDPPRSDGMARMIWVDGWGFEEDPHWADWGAHGKAGGPIRNAVMVKSVADRLRSDPGARAVCVAFIAAGSSGATGCADLAERANIPVNRHLLGKVSGALSARKPRSAAPSDRTSRQPDPDPSAVPNAIPGPCGRCGRVSYLITDNLLFWGDGYCVYWDDGLRRWRRGCGAFRELVSPKKVAERSGRSAGRALPVGQAAAGRVASRRRSLVAGV